jgi:prophage regulatory protein
MDRSKSNAAPSALLKGVMRMPTLKVTIELSEASIYRKIEEGKFPKPVSLGGRAVGWRVADIEEWIASLETSTNQGVPKKDRKKLADATSDL